MSIFINFEAGHLEIWNFIDEARILCAQGNMLGHRHIKSTAITMAPRVCSVFTDPLRYCGAVRKEHIDRRNTTVL
jgi:hypothetical protein